jgi:hypothetical protein
MNLFMPIKRDHDISNISVVYYTRVALCDYASNDVDVVGLWQWFSISTTRRQVE